MAENNILKISRTEQYKTVDELFKRSESSSVYYTLLVLSAFIVVCGLLLNNLAIVIGGMLVTPMLTPVLLIALGIATGEFLVVKNTAILVLKSIGIIAASALIAALIFGQSPEAQGFKLLDNTLRAGVLYFIVALASGIAATFAWVRKDVAEILPGVAIAISLVPPLSSAGIWLSVFNLELSRFYFLVFLFNLLGVILGSFIIFALLKFYKAEEKVAEKAKEVQEENDEKKSEN